MGFLPNTIALWVEPGEGSAASVIINSNILLPWSG